MNRFRQGWPPMPPGCSRRRSARPFPASSAKSSSTPTVTGIGVAHIAQTPAAQLRYLGIALYGRRSAVARLTGSLPLLR